MKISIYLVLLVFVAVCYSCNSDSRDNVPKDFRQEFVVTIEKKIGDSIIYDNLIEYFAEVNLKDSIYTWNKYYFNRIYEDLSTNGTAYVYDTVEIKVELDDDFGIKHIVNWETLYSRVKKEVDRLIESAPDSRKESIRDFAYSFSLDSSAIADKNTQDIQVFNLGYQFLYREEQTDTSIFLIKRNDSIVTLNYQSNESKDLTQLSSILGVTRESSLIDYKLNIEIMKNTNSNKLIYLNYIISFSSGGIENSVTTTMLRTDSKFEK